ncbi:HdeD family acid-resistance protein [Sphingomicrobium aestuariivivum]|uniref:HdeD family acid-resistance protein n=1 Tax=Sphingomicrobium aestuariivivum TaxID=1582356 RepID=UPI001FD65AA0|nr:DUF308 domain-containing protein [Sphingomicrobium aestuariivivum]MCJ8191806.1 DUF308 domain-containing protein [Sphingomicrobium aestuariivivum]
MENKTVLLVTGIVMLIGGILALFNPFAATLAAEIFAAWVFLISGILQVIAAFAGKIPGKKIWPILFGLILIWLGWSLLGHPLAGIVALTIVVGVSILIGGISKLLWGVFAEGVRARGLLILSGFVSVALGIMILGNIAGASTVLLGIILGIDLVSSGIALIVLSRSPKGEVVREGYVG